MTGLLFKNSCVYSFSHLLKNQTISGFGVFFHFEIMPWGQIHLTTFFFLVLSLKIKLSDQSETTWLCWHKFWMKQLVQDRQINYLLSNFQPPFLSICSPWQARRRPDTQKEAGQTGFCTSDKKSKMSNKLKMLNILNCLKTGFDCIWLHRDFIPWDKHLGSGGPQQVHVPPLVVAATAAAQKGGKFPYLWAGPEVYSFLLSSPTSPAPSLRQGMFASCSAWIHCKRKTYLQGKNEETSLFLPYGCLHWKPKGETWCSIEARLVLMKLIQQPRKATADYHWLQRKLNHTPRMHMITNSKSLAHTVSNHHPYS